MGLTKEEFKQLAPWAQESIREQMKAQGSSFLDTPDEKKGKQPIRRLFGYLLHRNPERQRKLAETRAMLAVARNVLNTEKLNTAAKLLETVEQLIVDELNKE